MSIRGTLVSIVKMVTPAPLVRLVRAARRSWRDRSLGRKSAAEVFSEIDARGTWGGRPGEFSSGSGTRNEGVVTPCVSVIERLADERGFRGKAFMDPGCGDFSVGRRLVHLCSRYTGVDVVPALLECNRAMFGDATTWFVKLDATRDDLPPGDVCFIRQVLQHLSNGQIRAILDKLSRYRGVFITEHHPSPNPGIVPNLDKVHGGDIRLYRNAGVYLDEPPFSLPAARLQLVLEVPGAGLGGDVDQGMIRTYLSTPSA